MPLNFQTSSSIGKWVSHGNHVFHGGDPKCRGRYGKKCIFGKNKDHPPKAKKLTLFAITESVFNHKNVGTHLKSYHLTPNCSILGFLGFILPVILGFLGF